MPKKVTKKLNIPVPAKMWGWEYARFVTFFDPEFDHLDQTDNFLYWKHKEK